MLVVFSAERLTLNVFTCTTCYHVIVVQDSSSVRVTPYIVTLLEWDFGSRNWSFGMGMKINEVSI